MTDATSIDTFQSLTSMPGNRGGQLQCFGFGNGSLLVNAQGLLSNDTLNYRWSVVDVSDIVPLFIYQDELEIPASGFYPKYRFHNSDSNLLNSLTSLTAVQYRVLKSSSSAYQLETSLYKIDYLGSRTAIGTIDTYLVPSYVSTGSYDEKIGIRSIAVSRYSPTGLSVEPASLVAWTRFSSTSQNGADIVGSLMPSDSTAVPKKVFSLTNSVVGVQDQTDVTHLANGNYAVAFSGYSESFGNTDDRDVFLTIFNHANYTISSDKRVNSDLAGDQINPSVAAVGTDRLAVAWQSSSDTETDVLSVEASLQQGSGLGDQDIYVRMFDLSGNPKSGAIVVANDDSLQQVKPDVAAIPDSSGTGSSTFVVVWGSQTLNFKADIASSYITCKLFNKDGTEAEGFLLDLSSQYPASSPTVGVLADGRFAVSWIGQFGNRVMTKVFDVSTAGRVITGTDVGDKLLGTDYADKIYGLGGADVLYGNGGDDVLIGGPGGDYLYGGDGTNTASYSTSKSAISLDLSITTGPQGLAGDAEGDRLYAITNIIGSPYADTITGNGEANVLSGGRGNDVLNGGVGDDTLMPGTGVNKLYGGSGFDIVSYKGMNAGVTVNLGDTSGASNAGEAKGDYMSGINGIGGTNFADELIGNSAGNKLIGYAAIDTLTGKGGADKFVFGELEATSADRINDFSHAENDTIELRADAFGLAAGRNWVSAGGSLVQGASPDPASSKPTILFDTETGVVTVDLDGTGSGQAVKLLEFTVIPDKLYADDFHLY